MKLTQKQLNQIIKEEIRAVIEEQQLDELGIGRALKGVAGAVKGKAWDKIKGTGNLGQTVQAEKQITAMVQDLAEQGYGGPEGAQRLAATLQKLAAAVAKSAKADDPTAGF